jgi:hypothetical protein
MDQRVHLSISLSAGKQKIIVLTDTLYIAAAAGIEAVTYPREDASTFGAFNAFFIAVSK